MLVERLSPHWSSTGLTPFLGRPGQRGYFCATPMGRRLVTAYDLAFSRLTYIAHHQWNRVLNLESIGSKAGNLPLGHRGLQKFTEDLGSLGKGLKISETIDSNDEGILATRQGI
ncbi:hypothetical protein AVEN_198837-1 [Araneus ventricosus]|uniref:Uncharacterized protein n=1 Tax=Araneus ventricosus TaxID=182803 RepID=A0A4Y2JDN3_ARAVE|nr:hypothetical protein AVEN_198837-1 [Araneus ventricosus]